MTRHLAPWAMVVVVAACRPSADVVAVAIDAGSGDAAQSTDARAPTSCGDAPAGLTMLAKSGAVYDLDYPTMVVTKRDLAACGIDSGAALAVDRSGRAWIATASTKMFVTSGAGGTCVASGALAQPPRAMTFVWDPSSAREKLYAVVDTKLVTIDPTTFAFDGVAPLTPSLDQLVGLAGTADGWLLALAGDPLVNVAYVDRSAGVVKPSFAIKSPLPTSRFAGAVPRGKTFEIVVGTQAWSYELATTNVTFEGELFTTDPTIVSVATSPCAGLGN